MKIAVVFVVFVSALIGMSQALTALDEELKNFRISPKFSGLRKLKSGSSDTTLSPDDEILNKLDASLTEISTVYMQALFSGTHTAELDARMRHLEIELFDLLDELYKAERLNDYMRYEAEVTRQMILYNMLKKLFGYTDAETEK